MMDKLVDLLRGRGMLIFWVVLLISIALIIFVGPIYGFGFAFACFLALSAIDRYARRKAKQLKSRNKFSR